jgi:hypothetical protein
MESLSSCLFDFPKFAGRKSRAVLDASGEVEGVGKDALLGDFGQCQGRSGCIDSFISWLKC